MFNRNNGDSQSWILSLVGDWNNTIINGISQSRSHDAAHELTQINEMVLNDDVNGIES